MRDDLVVIEKRELEEMIESAVALALRSELKDFKTEMGTLQKMMWVFKKQLTVEEAEKYLGVGYQALKEMEARGLRVKKIGRRKYYSRKDLNAFIDQPGAAA